MADSTITVLFRCFNIIAATVMAFFAIYGAIAVFAKNSNLNIFRGSLLIRSFCVASLFALILEATVCNFPHYLKYFSDAALYTLEVSPQDSTVILTSDGTLAKKFTEAGAGALDSAATAVTVANSVSSGAAGMGFDSVTAVVAAALATNGGAGGDGGDGVLGGVVFKDLDRRVTSVFIDPVFGDEEWVGVVITATTEEFGDIAQVKAIIKGMPHTKYIQLQPCGKVSKLKITFHGDSSTGASRIAINRQIPLYFNGLRLFAAALLFFAVIVFAYKPLRAEAARFLFDYRFDPSSGKQNAVYVLSVVLLILFSWICANTSVVEDSPQAQQYNKYLVEAIIAGRAHLEAGNPEKLLKAPNPYKLDWLDENKYVRGVDWMADWVYYKGRFYCYFGPVPALALYVPYNLITGKYLSNHGGIFIFAAISIILLARLWRFFVRKYMPDARFAFYLLSFFALFFASGWFCPLRFTRFYSIVSAGGFMFVIAGILLLFEAVDRKNIDQGGGKPDRSKLFFAAMCLALSVGCRPNLLFASLLVPVVLWKHKLWKYLPLMAVPYIAVAVPICWYNYARFGSILDFGFNYNMTNLSATAYGLLNPIGRLINTFNASLSYLFSMNRYSFFFPYVEVLQQHDKFLWPIVKFYDKGYGMINFPITFCLFFFFRGILIKSERPKTFYVSAVFLAAAAVLISVNSYLAGFSGRYAFDFAVFIILPSLFCAYHWGYGGVQTPENRVQIPIRVRQKITYILLAFSIFVGLFLFATTVTNDATPGSPALYLYMRQSLVLLGIV